MEFHHPSSSFSDDRIEVVLSPDGGDAFSASSVVVGELNFYNAPVLRDGAFLPAAATARETGAIFVSYQAVFDGRPHIMFPRSLDHGVTWSRPLPVSDNPAGVTVATPSIGGLPTVSIWASPIMTAARTGGAEPVRPLLD